MRRPARLPPLLPVLQESRPELDLALLLLAERLLAAPDPQSAAEALLDAVVRTYGFPRGAVLGMTSGHLSPLASHGLLDGSPGRGASPAVDRAHEQGAVQVVAALSAADEPYLTRLVPAGSDVVVVPLDAADRPVGALLLQVPALLRGQKGSRVIREVERAARSGALALGRVQRLVQLERLAATDDLTMIANRRSFMASLDRELARSVRRDEPLSLVILDLDEFKQVNDVHGHPAGDEALRNVAAALTMVCRDVDTPARYGGEEFAVVLPDCGIDRSLDIAERLRAAVRAAPAVRTLTASAGVATFPNQAYDRDGLIEAADAALLLAKRSGRDRTVVAPVKQEQRPGASRYTGAPQRRPGSSGEPSSGQEQPSATPPHASQT